MNPLGKKDKTQIFVRGIEMHKKPLLCAIILSRVRSGGTLRGSGHVYPGKSGWEGNARQNGVSGCEWWRRVEVEVGWCLRHWWTVVFGQFDVGQWPTTAERVELYQRVFQLAALTPGLRTAQSQVLLTPHQHNGSYCLPQLVPHR